MDELKANPSKDDCNLALLAHLLGIFTGFIGALIIWLVKKDESPFVAEHAREALNFQITLAIAYAVSFVLIIILIGAFLMTALWIVNVVFSIVACIAASKGQNYQYPFVLRLVK
jgi:uncharacterized Tic20 family protein